MWSCLGTHFRVTGDQPPQTSLGSNRYPLFWTALGGYSDLPGLVKEKELISVPRASVESRSGNSRVACGGLWICNRHPRMASPDLSPRLPISGSSSRHLCAVCVPRSGKDPGCGFRLEVREPGSGPGGRRFESSLPDHLNILISIKYRHLCSERFLPGHPKSHP